MNNNMNNIFVLNSPLQYLNAIEAIKYFNLENNILLLKNSGSDWNKTQIKQLHTKFGNLFSSTYELEDQKGLIYKLQPKTKQLLPFLNNIDIFFSGSIGESLNQYLMNLLKPGKIIYLDDGTKSLKLIERNNEFIFKNYIKRLLGSYNYFNNSDVIYFTAYFKNHWPSNYHIIPNEYRFLSSFVEQSFTQDSSCFFLISPIVESGRIKPEEFKNLINQIIAKYDGNIKFVLHRYSDIDLMTSLINIERENILTFDNIIEVELINKKIYPKKIASFISSALLNLSFIFKDADLKCFSIPDEYDAKNDSENLLSYYDLLKSHNIKIEELDC